MSLWKTPQPTRQPEPRSTLMFADDLTAEEVRSRKSIDARRMRECDALQAQTVDTGLPTDHGTASMHEVYGVEVPAYVPKHGEINHSKPVALQDIYAPSRHENTDPRQHPVYGSETPIQKLAREEREAEDRSRLDKIREGVERATKRAETLS